MTEEKLDKLSVDIKEISKNFELKPFADHLRRLNEDFDIASVQSPKHYQQVMDQISELLRESRVLFLYSILNKVCLEEGKPVFFDIPYQASMRYDGVVRKDNVFYLIDEDGDWADLFTSENFTQFIDDQYWEICE